MIKKIVLGFVSIILLASLGLVLSGNEHLFRAMQLTWLKGNDTANINDGQDFDTRFIKAGEVDPWEKHPDYNSKPLDDGLRDFLERTNSVAYLIIKEGKLHTEFYFPPYEQDSMTNSFSMAKTMTTMLIGAAVEDGLIESFDDLAWKYIPELKDLAPEVTLAHLSAMTSGVDWEEDYYTPFSPTPKLLYGYDVETYALSRDYPVLPGEEYYYASVSTQVLGVALKRALSKRQHGLTVSEYFSEKFWKPMGMNADGSWHLDSMGMELTYCCVNTNARNFARFGVLLSQFGKWKGQQLLPEDFVRRMIAPNLTPYYGHSVWTDDRENPIFSLMMGHLGQYVIIVPAHDLVVVRLGEFRDADADHVTHFIPKEVAYYVDEAIKRAAVE